MKRLDPVVEIGAGEQLEIAGPTARPPGLVGVLAFGVGLERVQRFDDVDA